MDTFDRLFEEYSEESTDAPIVVDIEDQVSVETGGKEYFAVGKAEVHGTFYPGNLAEGIDPEFATDAVDMKFDIIEGETGAKLSEAHPKYERILRILKREVEIYAEEEAETIFINRL